MSIPNFPELAAKDLSFAKQLEVQVLDELAFEESVQLQTLALARCASLTRQTSWVDFIPPGGQLVCRDVLGNSHIGRGAVSGQWLFLELPRSYCAINSTHLVSVSGLAPKKQPVCATSTSIEMGDELCVWLTDGSVCTGVVETLGEDYLRLRASLNCVFPISGIVAVQKVCLND